MLRELDSAAALRLKASQYWADYYIDYGIFFDIVLGDCARAKPNKAKCDITNLDIDDDVEFEQLVVLTVQLSYGFSGGTQTQRFGGREDSLTRWGQLIEQTHKFPGQSRLSTAPSSARRRVAVLWPLPALGRS